MTTSYESANNAINELDELTHDESIFDATRILLCDRDARIDDFDEMHMPHPDDFERIRRLLNIIFACDSDLIRERQTDLALAQSLCPLHFTDYAICFDDDDPTCAQIRTIHPSHDT